MLNFGYETQFYKAHLSTWITRPVSQKGHWHYIIEETRHEEAQTRVQVRDFSQHEAEYLISFFQKMIKAKWNRDQLEKLSYLNELNLILLIKNNANQ